MEISRDDAPHDDASVLRDVVVVLIGSARWDGQDLPSPWRHGVLELEFPGEPSPHVAGRASVTTDAGARSTYFHPRVSGRLYRSTWWLPSPDVDALGLAEVWQTSDARVFAVEIRTADRPSGQGQDRNAHVVVHLACAQSAVLGGALRRLCASGSERALAEERIVADLTAGHITLVDPDETARQAGASLSKRRRWTSLTYARQVGEPTSLYPNAAAPADQHMLHALATGVNPASFEPTPEEITDSIHALSASWQVKVMRDGVAFLARAAPDPFLEPVGDIPPMAQTLARTLYVDTVVLSMVQRDIVHAMTEELASIATPALADHAGIRDQERQLNSLTRDVDAFRTGWWFEDVTERDHGNVVLRARQRQLGIPGRWDAMRDELAERAQISANAVQAHTNTLLNHIAVVGFMASFVVGVYAIVLDAGDDVRQALWVVLTSALCSVTALLVFHRLDHGRWGRSTSAGRPRGRHPDSHRHPTTQELTRP